MNIKKLFPEKRLTKKELLDFLDKKGFYIILVLCIIVVGATAVFVTTYNITSNSNYDTEKIIPDEIASINPVSNPSGLQASIGSLSREAGAVSSSTDTTVSSAQADTTLASQTAAQGDETAVAAATTSQSKSNTAQPSFVMPVLGDVILEFANDKLVYSKTLEEWRTHSGIDLASDRGTSVKAVMDGVVSEIKKDPRFGVTGIINHSNGLKTLYANLASDNMVFPNQIVKQGEVIGSIGNTAFFESVEQSHLHFEVLKNSETVNPGSFLQISKATT